VRAPPELQILASMEALGAVVRTIELPQLYMALSQHVFDGQENPIAVIYFNKFYEVQKHLALTRHVYNNMVHTIGTYTWRRLSPEQQAIFREESAAAGNLMRRLIGEQEAELIGKLEAAGLQVTRPDLAPFRARMEPAYKRIAAYAGEANVKKFQEMVEQARNA
jgi:TRAP-type transport system periplasmic protein